MSPSVFHIYSKNNLPLHRANLKERIIAQFIDGILLGALSGILLALFSRGQLFAVWISPMIPIYLLQVTEGYLPLVSDWWWGGYYIPVALPFLSGINVAFPAPLQWFYYAVYYGYFHYSFGQTPGKMMKGLVVLGSSGNILTLRESFWRWFGYLVSILPLGTGFWIFSIPKNRRTWHDQLAGTDVFSFLDAND